MPKAAIWEAKVVALGTAVDVKVRRRLGWSQPQLTFFSRCALLPPFPFSQISTSAPPAPQAVREAVGAPGCEWAGRPGLQKVVRFRRGAQAAAAMPLRTAPQYA